MTPLIVATEHKFYNSPMIWAKHQMLFEKCGIDLEINYYRNKIDLFNAIELGKADMAITTIGEAVERMACQIEVTIVKAVGKLPRLGQCFAKDRNQNTEAPHYFGFLDSAFDYDLFAAKNDLNVGDEPYFQVQSGKEVAEVFIGADDHVFFMSEFSNESVEFDASRYPVVEEGCAFGGDFVCLLSEGMEGNLRPTSNVSEANFCKSVKDALSVIDEVAGSFSGNEEAISKMAIEFHCDPMSFRNKMASISWGHSLEPCLEEIREVTKVLTRHNLSPMCDIYPPEQFWRQI